MSRIFLAVEFRAESTREQGLFFGGGQLDLELLKLFLMLSGDFPEFLLLPVAELCQAVLHPSPFLHGAGDLGLLPIPTSP